METKMETNRTAAERELAKLNVETNRTAAERELAKLNEVSALDARRTQHRLVELPTDSDGR